MAALRLEQFDAPDRGSAAPGPQAGAADLEEARLGAFEAGYKAGWDDASAALADAEAELQAEVGRNLQALSFTYHEARNHVLRALSPLLAEVAARLLPQIAHAALPALVAEALAPYAEIAAEAPVLIRLHPANRQRVEALVGVSPGLPLHVCEDADLPVGQIWLQLGETETRVDIEAALTTIRVAMDDFFQFKPKDADHG